MGKIRAAAFDGIEQSLEQPVTGKYYVLMIAVDHYPVSEDTSKNFVPLSNPVRDANQILKVLLKRYRIQASAPKFDLRIKDKDRYGISNGDDDPIPVYEDGPVICLYNEAAKRGNIIDKLDELANLMEEDDALLVYFAGHGTLFKNNYYLVAHDSEKGKKATHVYVDELYNAFENYSQDKKCRNLLVVLDACHSGGSRFGMHSNENEIFSRQILASCRPNQTADDGEPGEGSPFANAFARLLAENSQPYLSFNELTVGRLQSFFEPMRPAKFLDQMLSLGSIPNMKNGQGFFIFELSDKEKPEVSHLNNTFIEDLSFEPRIDELSKQFKFGKADFLLITTFGHPFGAHRVLGKKFFKQWLFHPDGGGFSPAGAGFEVFETTLPKVQAPFFDTDEQDTAVKQDKTKEIWEALADRFGADKNRNTLDKSKMFQHIFSALTGDADNKKTRHVIVNLKIELAGSDLLAEVEAFCAEFYKLYQSEIDKLDKFLQGNIGKLFLIISDTRADGLHFFDNKFKERLDNEFGSKFTLITTQKIGTITRANILPWLSQAKNKIRVGKLPNLTIRDFLPPTEEDCMYPVNDFILKVAGICEIDGTEVTNQLFDNKFI